MLGAEVEWRPAERTSWIDELMQDEQEAPDGRPDPDPWMALAALVVKEETKALSPAELRLMAELYEILERDADLVAAAWWRAAEAGDADAQCYAEEFCPQNY